LVDVKVTVIMPVVSAGTSVGVSSKRASTSRSSRAVHTSTRSRPTACTCAASVWLHGPGPSDRGSRVESRGWLRVGVREVLRHRSCRFDAGPVAGRWHCGRLAAERGGQRRATRCRPLGRPGCRRRRVARRRQSAGHVTGRVVPSGRRHRRRLAEHRCGVVARSSPART